MTEAHEDLLAPTPLIAAYSTRPATGEDVEGIETLVARAYASYIEVIGHRPAPMDANYAAQVSERTCFVASVGERLVGLVVLVDDPGRALLIDNLAVDPAFSGQGVGHHLAAIADRVARERGYPELRLHTNAGTEFAQAWCETLGFDEYARGADDGFERVFMRKPVGVAGRG